MAETAYQADPKGIFTILDPCDTEFMQNVSDCVGGGPGGGAPTSATFITQTSNATLTAEQALASLATGVLKSTTGTGVVSIATAGADYMSPLSGAGSPEGAVTASPGQTYLNTTAPEELYIKKTGTGNTGWLLIVGL